MTIDWWTLALQTVNFLVLVWILARFFFRPIREIVSRRQQAAAKVLADAEAARRDAVQERDDAQKMRVAVDAQREQMMAAAQSEAERERNRLLSEAKAEAEKLVGEARSAAAQQCFALEQSLIGQARDLSLAIASRLVARLPPDSATEMFVEALCRQIAELKPEMRAAFDAEHAVTDVVTASPLSTAEQREVTSRLEAVFGFSLKLQFRRDPAVIAGIELIAPQAFIRSSWREDLDHIREELTNGRPSAG